jgi:Gluconate 2-dehydrogenase subunit 3
MDTSLAMDRRGLLGRMALLLGAAALPAEALAAPAAKAKRFLKPAQLKLLSAVTDTILPATDTPGALAAKVPARIDSLLANWASADTRSTVTAALARIDAAAKAQKGKGFAKLSAAERAAVLKPHDEAALKKVPPPPGAPAAIFFMSPTYVADPGYYRIKDLTLDLYYFSEIGTASELAYNHVPGKWQPSVKLTATSRPQLGTGPF